MPLWRSTPDTPVDTHRRHQVQLLAVPAQWWAWVYFEFGTVKITGHPESTAEYIWGDRTLRNIRCKTCGCVTHWEPLQPQLEPSMA